MTNSTIAERLRKLARITSAESNVRDSDTLFAEAADYIDQLRKERDEAREDDKRSAMLFAQAETARQAAEAALAAAQKGPPWEVLGADTVGAWAQGRGFAADHPAIKKLALEVEWWRARSMEGKDG